MSKPDHRRLDELKGFHADSCRQIATFVLEDPNIPEADRLCAASILGALDGADHCDHLTIIPVDREMLMTAAIAEAERLWEIYGDSGRGE